jgi:hypothetical protein
VKEKGNNDSGQAEKLEVFFSHLLESNLDERGVVLITLEWQQLKSDKGS